MPDIPLPCVKHNCPCPYADMSGKEHQWMCYGVRGGKKMFLLQECPQIELAREAWAKANRRKNPA